MPAMPKVKTIFSCKHAKSLSCRTHSWQGLWKACAHLWWFLQFIKGLLFIVTWDTASIIPCLRSYRLPQSPRCSHVRVIPIQYHEIYPQKTRLSLLRKLCLQLRLLSLSFPQPHTGPWWHCVYPTSSYVIQHNIVLKFFETLCCE